MLEVTYPAHPKRREETSSENVSAVYEEIA